MRRRPVSPLHASCAARNGFAWPKDAPPVIRWLCKAKLRKTSPPMKEKPRPRLGAIACCARTRYRAKTRFHFFHKQRGFWGVLCGCKNLHNHHKKCKSKYLNLLSMAMDGLERFLCQKSHKKRVTSSIQEICAVLYDKSTFLNTFASQNSPRKLTFVTIQTVTCTD